MNEVSKNVLKEYIKQEIDEKLIMHGIHAGGDRNYGNIVISMGGSASGKGFVLKNFLDASRFTVFDVDELKLLILKVHELKNKFPEIRGLNLKNEEDVTVLHNFIKEKKIKDAYLNRFFGDRDPGRLPNLYFDITGKDRESITSIIDMASETGYKPVNINLVYVLNDIDIQIVNNRERNRTVSEKVLIKTTVGAAKTFFDIIKTPIQNLKGRIDVVLNLKHFTKIEKSKSGGSFVKDFRYFNIKAPNKPIDREKYNREGIEALVNNYVLGKEKVKKFQDH
jgi:hypothetical protein